MMTRKNKVYLMTITRYDPHLLLKIIHCRKYIWKVIALNMDIDESMKVEKILRTQGLRVEKINVRETFEEILSTTSSILEKLPENSVIMDLGVDLFTGIILYIASTIHYNKIFKIILIDDKNLEIIELPIVKPDFSLTSFQQNLLYNILEAPQIQAKTIRRYRNSIKVYRSIRKLEEKRLIHRKRYGKTFLLEPTPLAFILKALASLDSEDKTHQEIRFSTRKSQLKNLFS